MRIAGALSPYLDPHGFEDYTLDEPTSDDSEDLFLSGFGPSSSGEGQPFCYGWPLGYGWGWWFVGEVKALAGARVVDFWRGRGVSFARPHLFHVVITGRVVRGCIGVGFLVGC